MRCRLQDTARRSHAFFHKKSFLNDLLLTYSRKSKQKGTFEDNGCISNLTTLPDIIHPSYAQKNQAHSGDIKQIL
jgi:hypothetical protein